MSFHSSRLLAPSVLALTLFGALVLPSAALADAVIKTQAMLSTTIAEIFVEEGLVAVELEIGADDLEAFGNLLPDELWQRLGKAPKPLAERYREFFERDFVLSVDGSPALPPRIETMELRQRVRRDDITGEPLPVPEGEEETVLFVRLEYPTPPRPETLAFGGGLAAGRVAIGFVTYHEGIAVNDFRYLTPSQTLELDWADPWYSSFSNRNLRRSFAAPMSGFLYIEPYEVRKEIIARPKDLQRWVDLGLEGSDTIPVEIQAELKRTVTDFLRERMQVEIDGRAVPGELAQINFLERTLKTSQVVEPPRELDVNAAILGIIFVYPTDGLPEQVSLDWDLWDERIQRVPASSVDQAGGLPTILDPEDPVLVWKNFLQQPDLPTLVEVERPPGLFERALLALRWPLLLVTLLALGGCLLSWRRDGRPAPIAVAALLIAAVVTGSGFWLERQRGVDSEKTREVVAALLHNVYLAFDYRDEEQIYDVLARSVAGDLLADIYLETRRGLELANQGGARAKVKEIELGAVDARPSDHGGFLADATWEVGGSVGHWGHLHQRRNRYRAELEIAPVDGEFKLLSLEILEEERI